MESDETSRLILIGYWRSPGGPEWPDVRDFVDESQSDDERGVVGVYLMHGSVVRAYMGASHCRVCGEWNGSQELSDGVYVWPEGLAHYVLEHAVRMPETFVEHVRARVRLHEESDYAVDWWLEGGLGELGR